MEPTQQLEEAASPIIVAQKKLEITPPPVPATITIPPPTLQLNGSLQKDDSYAYDEESDIPMMPTLKPAKMKITPEFSKMTAVVA